MSAEPVATIGYRYGGQEEVTLDQLDDKIRRMVQSITSEEFETPDNEHTQSFITRPDEVSMTVYVDGLAVVQHLRKPSKKYRCAETAAEMTEWLHAFAARTLKTTPQEGWVSSLSKVTNLPGKEFRACTWEGELAQLTSKLGEGVELLEAVAQNCKHPDYSSDALAWIEKHGLLVNKDERGPEILLRLLDNEHGEVRKLASKLLVRAFKACKTKEQDRLLPVMQAALTSEDENVVFVAARVEFKRKQASPRLVQILLELMKRSGSSVVAENLIRLFDWKRPKEPAIVEVAAALLASKDRWARHLVRQELENRTFRHAKGPIRDELEALHRSARDE